MVPRRIELPEEKSTLPSKTIREWGAIKYVVDEGGYARTALAVGGATLCGLETPI